MALVVDCSGSIRTYNPPGFDNWQFVINFLVRFVSQINVGVHATNVGAVSFGTRLNHNINFVAFFLIHVYTYVSVKAIHLTFDHNFGKCRPISIIRSLSNS